MKTKLLLLLTLLIAQISTSQEVLKFADYNGGTSSITAATSTVNDDIILQFEDLDRINNFYTDGQNQIYLYGGLDVSGVGPWQGAPVFNEHLITHPILVLDPSDDGVFIGKNIYSISINLSQFYTSVPDGATVTGFNIIFQNQFGGGGNNQTGDLYIDLVDAVKNSTLSTNEVSQNSVALNVFNNNIEIAGLDSNEKFEISMYDFSGKLIKSFNEKSSLNLNSISAGLYILNFKSDYKTLSKKVIIE